MALTRGTDLVSGRGSERKRRAWGGNLAALEQPMTTLLLVIVAVFNVGFLIGTWWGAGWKRRERDTLHAEVMRLRHEVSQRPAVGT